MQHSYVLRTSPCFSKAWYNSISAFHLGHFHRLMVTTAQKLIVFEIILWLAHLWPKQSFSKDYLLLTLPQTRFKVLLNLWNCTGIIHFYKGKVNSYYYFAFWWPSKSDKTFAYSSLNMKATHVFCLYPSWKYQFSKNKFEGTHCFTVLLTPAYSRDSYINSLCIDICINLLHLYINSSIYILIYTLRSNTLFYCVMTIYIPFVLFKSLEFDLKIINMEFLLFR